jgi:L-asparaginase II
VKPLQALVLYDSGAIDRFGIPEDEVAIVIASHSGEAFHIALVESLMRRIGIHEGDLLCGPHPPFDPPTRLEMVRSGLQPGVLHNNCSGKHAGMCAAAIAMGEPIAGYCDPAHPVQLSNRRRVASLCGIDRPDSIDIAIDGCSAPTFGLPLDRLATAFARLAAAGTGALAEDAGDVRRIWDAMVHHPEVIAGTRERIDTALMVGARASGIPLAAKAGAEGVYAVGVVSPRFGPLGIALKIEDGGERARNVVAIEILERLGIMEDSIREATRGYGARSLDNRAGRRIGEIRPCFDFSIDDA